MSAKRKTAGLILSATTGLLAVSPVFAGYRLNTLASFNGTNGGYPYAGLTLSSSTLYGTTYGYATYGTVFSEPITGGAPTVLGSFNSSNGARPYGGLILSGNTLYGTTYQGGTDNYGTVFSVPLTGGTPTVLASFNGNDGAFPEAGLTLSGNTLYGTTRNGGAYGVVFSIPLTGGTPTVLASFNGSNGGYPYAGLALSGNSLYGTTSEGGTYNEGTVFSLPLTGGSPTVLGSFSGGNGYDPISGLTLSGNTLYGTTPYGGGPTADGTVFSVPVAGGTPTVLASFNGSNGAVPAAGLTLMGNRLYGTTSEGGTYGYGTFFSVPLTGGSPTVLASFLGGSTAGLTLSGNTFYGTAANGMTYDLGGIFSLTPNAIPSLTRTAPNLFGSKLGTLAVTRSQGSYNIASTSFSATPTGYLAVTGFVSTDTEIFALNLSDNAPANLAADLVDAVSEMNAANYSGYSLTASTTDPTGAFGTGYDFFITIATPTLGTGSPYFGFDFTQLNGITDTLSASAVAVTGVAVPEPASLGLMAIGSLGLIARRRGRFMR